MKVLFTRRQSGFTVLELLIVMGVSVVVIGISGLSFMSHSMRNGELIQCQQQVGALAENARMEARASRAPVALLVRLNEEEYQMTLAKTDDEGEWTPVRRWATLKSSIDPVYTSPDYANACDAMMGGEYLGAIVFNEEGVMISSESGAYIILHDHELEIVSDADLAKARLVYISPMTGKVTLN